MSKKRDEYWQTIRGICILCVIMIHSLYLTDMFYLNISNIIIRKIINFAVATFIFMAGYFVHINNLKNFYISKIKRLIIPMMIWNLVYMIINYRNCLSSLSTMTLLKDFIFSTSTMYLYYIYVLIQLFLITPFLIKLSNSDNAIRKYFPILITPFYNAMLFICNYFISFNIPLYNYWLFGWISYFYLGILLKQQNVSKKENRKFPMVSLFASILEGVLIYISKSEQYNLAVSQLAIFNSIYSLNLCYFLVINKAKIENCNLKLKWLRITLIKLGNYSFGIYLSHVFILTIIKKFISKLSLNYYINVVLTFGMTAIIAYIANMIYYERVKELKNGKSYR